MKLNKDEQTERQKGSLIHKGTQPPENSESPNIKSGNLDSAPAGPRWSKNIPWSSSPLLAELTAPEHLPKVILWHKNCGDLNYNNLNCDNSNYPKPEKLDLQGWDEHEWRGGAAALLSWLGHRRLCRSWLAFYPLPTRPWVHLLQVVIVNTCCRFLLFLPPFFRISSSPHQNQSLSSPTSGFR